MIKDKKQKIILGIVLGLIMLFIVVISIIIITNDKSLDEGKTVDYTELNPQELHSDYLNNEISAKDKYTSNYYYFSGEIHEISEVLNDKYITLRYKYDNDNTKIIELDAYFNSKDEIFSLTKGQNVTVYCKFKQRSVKNYMNTITTYSFKDCKLNK